MSLVEKDENGKILAFQLPAATLGGIADVSCTDGTATVTVAEQDVFITNAGVKWSSFPATTDVNFAGNALTGISSFTCSSLTTGALTASNLTLGGITVNGAITGTTTLSVPAITCDTVNGKSVGSLSNVTINDGTGNVSVSGGTASLSNLGQKWYSFQASGNVDVGNNQLLNCRTVTANQYLICGNGGGDLSNIQMYYETGDSSGESAQILAYEGDRSFKVAQYNASGLMNTPFNLNLVTGALQLSNGSNTGRVYDDTIYTPPDSSNWSSHDATQNVGMGGYSVTDVSSILFKNQTSDSTNEMSLQFTGTNFQIVDSSQAKTGVVYDSEFNPLPAGGSHLAMVTYYNVGYVAISSSTAQSINYNTTASADDETFGTVNLTQFATPSNEYFNNNDGVQHVFEFSGYIAFNQTSLNPVGTPVTFYAVVYDPVNGSVNPLDRVFTQTVLCGTANRFDMNFCFTCALDPDNAISFYVYTTGTNITTGVDTGGYTKQSVLRILQLN